MKCETYDCLVFVFLFFFLPACCGAAAGAGVVAGREGAAGSVRGGAGSGDAKEAALGLPLFRTFFSAAAIDPRMLLSFTRCSYSS